MPNARCRPLAVLVAASLLLAGAGCGDDDDESGAPDGGTEETTTTTTASPAGRLTADGTVSFLTPATGAEIAGGVPFTLKAEGITIEPAGAVKAGAGHFHVIADHGCLAKGTVIPKDADHLHFGQGQSEGKIYLEPGEHTLCLQVGDGAHRALEATDVIEVEVGVTSKAQWCAVAAEQKDLEEAGLAPEAELGARQASFAAQRRLLAQLVDAIEIIDDKALREPATAFLEFRGKVADAFTGSADLAAADAKAVALREEQPSVAGTHKWVIDNCNGLDLVL